MVTKDKKNALSTPVTPRSVQIVCVHCKQRAAAADGTIPSLPRGGDFGGLHVVYVW